MSNYLYSIKTAFALFPILAILITLPYIIHQYRKYGSILLLRSGVVYSFILYIITIYFLVILPLPSRSEVATYTFEYVQLDPFYAVKYLYTHIYFNITDLHTYINLFSNSYFYQVIYNILITIPLGIYLRYYFKCSFPKTLIISLGFSLFFELTQLTGLYGIYPRPYRIFDVDDLITNTLGGIVGYLITPVVCCILPSREKLDEKAYERGKTISNLRRFVAFTIDWIILNIIMFITSFHKFSISYLNNLYVQTMICIIIYFIILPYFNNGKTFGRQIVKMRLTSIKEEKLKFYQIILREISFYGILFYSYPILNYLGSIQKLKDIKIILLALNIFVTLVIIKYFFQIIFKKLFKEKRYFYEKISNTKYISTIEEEKYIKPKDNNLTETN